MTFQRSEVRVGAWSSLAGGGTAELLASAGPDWLALDAQHGTWTDADILSTIRTVTDLPVWVRVADDSHAGIGRVLDAGAAGVIVPMVDTPAQAAEAAAACRYPPLGGRSWGPMHTLIGRPVPTTTEANAAVRCAVMIETPLALSNVEAIAAVDGVDMIFVGPFDLSIALGTDVDSLVADAADDAPLPRIVAACRAAGIRVGVFAGTSDRAEQLAELGFQDIIAFTDALLLGAAVRGEVARWNGAGAAGSGSSY
ncbi:hypothetical protein GIS00_14265 [Nakamurella sp. YIM 132087]|uniref:HpcH/HpaI aldolase/citrate lyase domain-containing protein n=1 Tax=Nakamurella alba TaxID=2665158 RepID=A0A7K1FQP7_9ACTN|nr:aldolase/citrate lyase family protein [Nakamurella alba]MTD15104.1 hypothetical protein [Nakamurella alba]